jgi:hypothetical protein
VLLLLLAPLLLIGLRRGELLLRACPDGVRLVLRMLSRGLRAPDGEEGEDEQWNRDDDECDDREEACWTRAGSATRS